MIGDGGWMLTRALLGFGAGETTLDSRVLKVYMDDVDVETVEDLQLRTSVSLVPKVRTHPGR